MQELVRRLNEIKQEKSEINKRLSSLTQEQEELEYQIMQNLDTLGVDQIRTDTLTVGIRETVVPQVVDWDAFYTFLVSTNAPYMLERRPSATAFRDYLTMMDGECPPGVEPYTKRSIATRKVG